ncbi:50S ribosomal protein L34e [Candidatus Woesearchaeota archaeon]|nr:50S ribosomal protein L34e [Candidatus Woesearchaeota archaeon]
MPAGKHKSRSMRRVFKRTPGGKTITHYVKRKPKNPKCSGCGKILPGIPRERNYKMKKTPLTKKRPERPYGGVLCSACAKKKLIAKARGPK